MSREKVIGAITEDSKSKFAEVVQSMKTIVDNIEEEGNRLFDKGNQASIGKVRKGAQQLKGQAQDIRILSLSIKADIAKAKENKE